MATVRIPKAYVSSIVFLAKLSVKNFAALRQAIFQEQNFLSFSKFAEEISGKIGITQEESQKLVSFIISLYSLKDDKNLFENGINYADVILEAAEKDGNIELKANDLKKLRERILDLSDDESPLKFLREASLLYVDHERILRESRIITDFRPVFSKLDGECDELKGGLISHSLKFRLAHSGNDSEEVHIALSSNDLRRLAEQIDEALSKENILKTFISSSELYCLEIED